MNITKKSQDPYTKHHWLCKNMLFNKIIFLSNNFIAEQVFLFFKREAVNAILNT